MRSLMSQPTFRQYIICYDIKNERRLQKIGKFMNQEAIRLQYSTFLFIGTQPEHNQLIDQLNERIKTSEDDVRSYQIGDIQQGYFLGNQILPEHYHTSKDSL